ncbi:MAG: hypothetical protein HOP10_02005 [Chitinophagaceae bacterium]|nr:hypothetical protein [Chitinophagaceae bacterium]
MNFRRQAILFVVPLLLCILYACSGNRRVSNARSKELFRDSTARVYSLDAPPEKELAYYITPSGKKIILRKQDDPRLPEEQVVLLDPSAVSDSVLVHAMVMTADLATRAGPNDPFKGSVRKTPKTNFSMKRYETFPTIPALFRSLKSREFMNNLRIGHLDSRVEQENRNVIIKKAYLYTITVEADNDLHLLIGSTPSYIEGVTRVFNAEISGIPTDGSSELKDQMREVRRKALDHLGDVPVCGRRGYLQSNTRISIRGSLFYDSHHATKPAKCREVEGESAWEIHPVRDISFDN